MNIFFAIFLFVFIILFVGHHGDCTRVHRMPMHKTPKIKKSFVSARQIGGIMQRFWHNENSSYSMVVLDYADTEYVSKISIGNIHKNQVEFFALIGTPPQEFRVQLDTGSGVFWVVDSTCGNTGCYVGCKPDDKNFCAEQCDANCCEQNAEFNLETMPMSCRNTAMFKGHASSTYRRTNQTFSVKYGYGFAAGSIGKDMVKLGPASDSNALTLENAYFGQADQKDTQQTNFSGILGLSYMASGENIDPVVIQAYKKGVLKKPFFSIYLATEGNVNGKAGGVLTLGDADKENCGEIAEWIDIIPNPLGHWKFNIDQITLDNGTMINAEINTGMVDTGTSLMFGPWEQVNRIYNHYDIPSADQSISCDQEIGPIVFLINGRNYAVTKDTLILRKDDNKCVFAMQGTDSSSWLLGDPFCRKFCQVHDIEKRRVALPEAKQLNE